MSTMPIVERLIPIGLIYVVVHQGVADVTHPDHASVLSQLRQAMDEELEGLPRPKRESATRHSKNTADAILRPFVERRESAAKFGLATYYAIRELIDIGAYELRDGPFSESMDAVLNPDGTLTEMANIEGIDKSAKKQARRVLEALRGMGYYQNRC